MRWIVLLLIVPACVASTRNAARGADVVVPAQVQAFLETHCEACHSADDAEAGLDLTTLSSSPHSDPARFEKWVRVVDRVHEGEMPPPESGEVTPAERAAFAESAGEWLRSIQQEQYAAQGRVRGRRLTNLQVERTLHALLGIDVPLADQLPQEQRINGFTTVAEGQSMSHFQLEQHLSIVDLALEEAFRRATARDEEIWSKTLDAGEISRQRPKSRTREPELLNDQAVVWSGNVIFYGRVPATTAKEDGWYRFVVRASAVNSPRECGVWCTVRSGRCVSSAPLFGWVGAFEATDEPGEWKFETWLPRGHMLEIRPGDTTLKRARFKGGQVGTGEGAPQNVPGVAIDSIVMERIHHGPGSEEIRKHLFGDLELKHTDRRQEPELVSTDPHEVAERLMRRFAERAFRRPVSDDLVAPYSQMVHEALDQGEPLLAALRGGYRALLCSPRFLYFEEAPGVLDDYALASRLSYFLWSSLPDDELLQLAGDGEMRDPDVLQQQVERMLADGRGRTFVEDFAAQWLDLDQIDFTEPDRKLYPEFDVIVQQSMLEETHAFLETMLRDNLSVTHLIDSDRTFLNSRLARYYDIDGVNGDELQQVSLDAQSHRGGLLTQGAILKVTANGTTTSPVIRGVWVSERLLGVEIPPPPDGVAAVEPDIRGAKTIREMLALHASEASCAGCHVKIDPPGFALENYDPSGQWRDKYLRVEDGRRRSGADIDPAHALPDGRGFESAEEFQQLVASTPAPLAENLATKLLAYGTGAPVGFADRPDVMRILAAAVNSDYGFRTLLTEVVLSDTFLSK
jgi:mono/diheme cytochrome c family protein